MDTMVEVKTSSPFVDSVEVEIHRSVEIDLRRVQERFSEEAILEVLKNTQRLFNNGARWVKGTLMKNRPDGEASFCVLGGFYATTTTQRFGNQVAERFAFYNGLGSIPRWNDAGARSFNDINFAFNTAISAQKEYISKL